MDDDQNFVAEIVEAIEAHGSVDYNETLVDFFDEGRDAEISLVLYAGDKYKITITEVH